MHRVNAQTEPSPADIARLLITGVRPEFRRALIKKAHWFAPAVREALLDGWPLSEIDIPLNPEALNCLRLGNVNTIGDLRARSLSELLELLPDTELLGAVSAAQAFRSDQLGEPLGGRNLEEVPIGDLQLSVRTLRTLAGVSGLAEYRAQLWPGNFF